MKISKGQRIEGQLAITAESLTAEQIREAKDRWPESISSERSANALGLRESSTAGGLPVYPPMREMLEAREFIAQLISKCWQLGSEEHTIEEE